jgi:phage gp36-like protein
MPLPVNYTTVGNVLLTRTELGSITALSSAMIYQAIGKVESMLNARLTKLYVVPIVPTPPLLETLATDLTVYKLLAELSLFKTERLKDSPWFELQKQAWLVIDQLASGAVTLTSSAGAVVTTRSDQVVAYSTTMNYDATFHDCGSMEEFVDDAQKAIDEGNRRG